ncbi:unnamed protein product [Mytilus edulis]|uniref:Uncharacterized protein n=1 Tax=Mytilus edulis TaxID=6550 RepID=A0A8S3S2K4_MYTED|nr:unnamed protein product [Mytilus edulis]
MSDSESEVTIQNQPEPEENSAVISASQPTPTQTTVNNHFSGLHPTWMLEQHLYERCMLPSESLKSTLVTLRNGVAVCANRQETTTAFIRGLPGSLRVFVDSKGTQHFLKMPYSLQDYTRIDGQTTATSNMELQTSNKGAVIDFVNRKVTFDPMRQLAAHTDVTVPPMSEVNCCKIKGTPLPDLIFRYFYKSPVLASHSLLAAKSLSEVRNRTVAHSLCNFTDKPITIKKNSNVGKFVCLSEKDKVFVVNESKTSASVQNTPIEDEGAVIDKFFHT